MSATAARDAERLFERVQELQEQLDTRERGPTQAIADELVSALIAMYGGGLERIVDALQAGGEEGRRIALELGEDPFVATLLLIHDLHPVPLADRVGAALDSVRPYMESHGGNVEVLSLTDGVLRIALQGSCSDCSASSATLELAIKQALEDAAPDLAGLEVQGLAPELTGLASPAPGDPPGSPLPMAAGIELPMVVVGGAPTMSGAHREDVPAPAPALGDRRGGVPASAPALGDRPRGDLPDLPDLPAWLELDEVAGLPEGTCAPVALAGHELLVANVDGTLLAYRDRCAACGEPLHGGELSSGALACPSCRRSFFLPAAGRSMDEERIQLQPVPLLREQGRVRVALG